MKDKTDELHENYYRKFGRLHACEALLSDELKQAIEKNLYTEYMTEYKLMHAADEIENKRAACELQIKTSELVPGKIRKFKFLPFVKKPNKAAELIDEEMYYLIQQEFIKQQQRIAELEQQLKLLQPADDGADPNEETENKTEINAVKPVGGSAASIN
jgi:trehalose/maltose hydrolase-like predicted phosphorylase